MSETYPPARLVWTVWGLGACLYLIGFFQRVAPGVISTELMREFTISAAALGNLSGFYFYSYVAMQVPTGLLADAWGPRRLLTAGALAAGAGGLLFALAPNFWLAGAGRFMVGASVAVAFVCMIKLASHWMAPRQFAFTAGLALLVGIIGAVSAGVPLSALSDAFGWRPTMAVVAVLTAGLAIAIWVLVRDDPAERGYRSHSGPTAHVATPRAGIRESLSNVLRHRNSCLLSLAPGGIGGPVMTFAGLWGIPFLTTHYGLSEATAAAYCSVLLIAWALGGPILGGLSDRIGRRKPLYLAGAAVAAMGWAVLIMVPDLPRPILLVLLTAIGFASGSMIIGFAFAKESVPARYAGTVAGLVNMGVMSGTMLLQPAIGLVLDAYWDGAMVEGLRVYGFHAYRTGFLLMLGWTVLALVVLAFSRETWCRPARD